MKALFTFGILAFPGLKNTHVDSIDLTLGQVYHCFNFHPNKKYPINGGTEVMRYENSPISL